VQLSALGSHIPIDPIIPISHISFGGTDGPALRAQESKMTNTVKKIAATTFAQDGKLTRAEIVAGVRAYATSHYNDPGAGWDIVCETWSDRQINDAMGVRTKSILGAIQTLTMYGGFKQQAEARAAAEAEAFDAVSPAERNLDELLADLDK
jgi:hypothetical protein